MTVFQFILIGAVFFGALLAIRAFRGEKSLAIKRIFAILIAVCGVFAILFPNTLTVVAHFFGIGRGTDLLLYGFVIATMIFGVAVLRAKARSDARVTELARSVALMEARLTERRSSEDYEEK